MKLDATAQGVYAIAPTPFHPDGQIDVASVDKMVDFYKSVGCTGITVLGIMGEAPKLDGAEAIEVATRCIRRAGTLGMIVGVSAPGFAACVPTTRSSPTSSRRARRSATCPSFCRIFRNRPMSS
jgi:4-hydroxy-tetrahydrodipicolinate synthase